MTFPPKVWGDALRRLQNDIPEFVFDAWIAPLTVKISDERLILGCPTSFHRDRIRLHHLATLERCWATACEIAGAQRPTPIDVLTRNEFAEAPGETVEPALIQAVIGNVRSAMRKVELESRAQAVNGPVDNPRNGGGAQGAFARSPYPSGSSSSVSSPSGFGSVGANPSNPQALRIVPRLPSDSRGHKHAARSRYDTALSAAGPLRNSQEDSSAPGQPGMQFDLDGDGARDDLPYSFESFIVGPCNALAREAALALARRRQQSLNQLYVGGGSGMGKTHLARATADEARLHAVGSLGPRARFARGGRAAPARDPRGAARVLYTTAEKFTSDFVSAMRTGRNEEWSKRYRGQIDLIVVEDIQFLVGRTKTQQELYHTIEHVLDSGGRVLLTGDRAPRDLIGLDERMRALVARGFVTELDRPDALVRRHVLRAKAAAGGVHLPKDCLDLLVDSADGSMRDIEGILIQVVTTASLLGRPIDISLTREAVDLKSGASTSLAPRKLDVGEVVQIVAAFFGTRPEALASRSRRRDVLVPRQLAMYLAHRYTEASLTEIGRSLGRDHPSVRNAITRIERQVLENAPLRYQVEALCERIDRSLDGRES